MIKKIYKAVFVNFRIFGLCAAMCMVAAFSSCSRDDESLTEPGRYSSEDITSYEDLFRVFWTVMDENYNYFYEEKERNNLDWDKVYAEYFPKFKALKTWEQEGYSNDEIGEESDIAESYFEEIINGITDQHFYVDITLPISSNVNYTKSYYSGMKKSSPLYYDKMETQSYMTDKVENGSLSYTGISNVFAYGGNLKSNPDIYYFTFNKFRLTSSFPLDLNKDDLLLDTPVSKLFIDRSELEENESLDAIENEELRRNIRDWTLEVYDAWYEALTEMLQSEILAREIDQFNQTEELTDALIEEAGKLDEIIEGLPSSSKYNAPDVGDDENAKSYVSNFGEKMRNLEFAYNFPSFDRLLNQIRDKDAQLLYSNFYNPLTRGDIKKLILDLRGNGGGAVIDFRSFTERLVTKEALVGYQRTKEGNGRFNYTPWVPVHTKPHPFGIPKDIPIVILTDKGSASMAEISTLGLKSQGDHVKSIGDYTAGATAGLSSDEDEYNGGTQAEEVGGVMSFYMPLMAFKDASGKVIEGIGIEPDVYVAPPTEEEIKDMEHNPEHRDRTLEKAIEVISGM
ncbi:S41 family peptidase [Sinomicrobium pectinilyticum]|uniref:Peptidase S41 n=1 Tax=Sinomicrobium pectinilyticum TaxID=1084421 RepID=A0A3N0DRF9_SINP1|nr:S41 family peptidase [Sinomicrobium pectinilyticum]RNL77933.1 peptidase S41 [Sinomicrobium pectinilyticum]